MPIHKYAGRDHVPSHISEIKSWTLVLVLVAFGNDPYVILTCTTLIEPSTMLTSASTCTHKKVHWMNSDLCCEGVSHHMIILCYFILDVARFSHAYRSFAISTYRFQQQNADCLHSRLFFCLYNFLPIVCRSCDETAQNDWKFDKTQPNPLDNAAANL